MGTQGRSLRRRSVDPHRCPQRRQVLRPDPVDRFVAHPHAPVRHRDGRHVRVAVDGEPGVEELRSPQFAQGRHDQPVKLSWWTDGGVRRNVGPSALISGVAVWDPGM